MANTKFKIGDKIELKVTGINYIGDFPAQYVMNDCLRIPVGSLDSATFEPEKPAKKPAAKKAAKKE